MLTNECVSKLSRELDLEVSRDRVLRYADLVGVKKNEDNDYRDITEADAKKIKLVTCLFEVGIGQEDIVEFLSKPITGESFNGIVDKVEKKSSIAGVTFQLLSEYAFNKLDK